MEVNLSQEDIDLISKQDSEMLATYIAIFRAIGALEDQSKVAMVELMKRKIKGDTFDYDSFIRDKIKEAAVSIKVPKVNDFKKAIVGNIINSVITGKDNINEKDFEQEETKEEVIKFDEQIEKDLKVVMDTMKELFE